MRIGSLPGRDEAIRARIRQLKRRSWLVGAFGCVAAGAAYAFGRWGQGATPVKNTAVHSRLHWAEELASGAEDELLKHSAAFLDIARQHVPSDAIWHGVGRLVTLVEHADPRVPGQMPPLLQACLMDLSAKGRVEEWLTRLKSRK